MTDGTDRTGVLRNRRRRWGVAAALAGIVLLAHGRYLGDRLPVGVDHTLQQAPWFAQRWSGGPPLFDPHTLSGVPLHENLQAALLYPPRWPFFFLADWRDYYGLYFFLHWPLALVGAYALGRGLRMRRVSALLVAVLYGCGGYLAGRPINPVILYASAWLPWLLLGATSDRPRHLWLTTLALAMILAIGSPHLYLYGALGYAIATVFLGPWQAPRGGERRRLPWAWVGRRLVHLGLAVALVLPTLLPGLRAVGRSVRTTGSIAANLAGSIEFSRVPQVFLGGTGGMIFPEFIDRSCYVGGAALLPMLALLALRRRRHDGRIRAAAVLAGVGLLVALGSSIGLQHVLPWIPGLKWLTGPNRALVLAALGLALLAGLGLDRLSPRRAARLAIAAGFLGLGALAWFLTQSSRIVAQYPYAPDAAQWLRVWLAAPRAVTPTIFPWLDAAIGLLAAGMILMGLRRRADLLRPALAALALAQCLHFAPRVWPPLRGRAFYDAPPPVRFLTGQARRASAPFRVLGYDALRYHDNDVDNRFLLRFLVPQLSTVFGLEDIQGFDPLIPERYAQLVEQTAGRSPINDPLRNLDLAWPDPRLLDLLGVRYLVGHPHDRRVTNLPLTLSAATPRADVKPIREWPTAPTTHWLFVSLIDSLKREPWGMEVARLHIDADEGRFSYAIRNGIETAAVDAARPRGLMEDPRFTAEMNGFWAYPRPVPEMHYEQTNANWRGRIDFGRPLHVRGAVWELSSGDIVVNIAAQACRLAAPNPEVDPWRRVFGTPEDMTPVYEYLAAKPRAVLVAPPAGAETTPRPLAEALALAGGPEIGRVRWLEYGSQAFSLEVETTRPALLVLRQPWIEGWRVEGADGALRPIGPGLNGIDLPAGRHRLRMVYRPAEVVRLAVIGWGILTPVFVVPALILSRRRARRCADKEQRDGAAA